MDKDIAGTIPSEPTVDTIYRRIEKKRDQWAELARLLEVVHGGDSTLARLTRHFIGDLATVCNDEPTEPAHLKQYFCETHDRVYHCEDCFDEIIGASRIEV